MVSILSLLGGSNQMLPHCHDHELPKQIHQGIELIDVQGLM
jgi:hypothetical protein